MAIYMKIDGVDGHVTTKGYEKWIEVDSLNFGVQRSIATKPGNVFDRESTKPSINEVVVSKMMDKTSPNIFIEACVGKAKPKVEIHICQTGSDKITPYAQYTLYNTLFSNYQVNAANKAQEEAPKETLNINFDKVEMKYVPHDQQHNAGSPIPVGYDLATGTKI